MAAKTVKKLLEFALTLFLASSAVFFMSRLAPSDPVEIILGENATFEDRQSLRRELKLDLPLWRQYSEFAGSLLRLDPGNSLVTGRRVADEIKDAFPYTVKLGLAALLLSMLAGAAGGIYAAGKEGRAGDAAFGMASSVMMVSPSFLTGPLFLLTFAVLLPVFPVSGDGSALSYFLPAVVLAIPTSAFFGRVLRVSLCEEKKKPYKTLAKEKGVGARGIYFIHLLPNSLIPFVQIAGLEFGALLTGAIITEKIFRIPGLGSLLARSVFSRDYPLMTALIILFSSIYLAGNLAADMVSPMIDPRVRGAD